MTDNKQIPDTPEEKQFHPWRLLGVIFLVVVVLAIVSAVVDVISLGPLEGRVL